ncbi:hypothetical protein ACNOYE_01665 [Nannocystaceae bacterium ST9]
MKRVVLALALLACREAPEPEPTPREREPSSAAAIDRDQLRADVREGLEQAIDDPALVRAHERAFTELADAPEVVDAAEKLLARLATQPRLDTSSAEFFAWLQDTPGMRATLAEYARANPELELDAIAAGFVGHVDARLTRPEIVDRLRGALADRLGSAGPVLGAALLREAGGVGRLADRVADRLVDPSLAGELDSRLGRDPERRAEALRRRLGDARHGADVLLALADALRGPEGVVLLAGLLDDETLAPSFADALARVLDDAGFRDQAAKLFELALASELDLAALDRELDALLAQPVLEREAAALLAELARTAGVRERVDGFVDRFASTPDFDRALLDALD